MESHPPASSLFFSLLSLRKARKHTQFDAELRENRMPGNWTVGLRWRKIVFKYLGPYILPGRSRLGCARGRQKPDCDRLAFEGGEEARGGGEWPPAWAGAGSCVCVWWISRQSKRKLTGCVSPESAGHCPAAAGAGMDWGALRGRTGDFPSGGALRGLPKRTPALNAPCASPNWSRNRCSPWAPRAPAQVPCLSLDSGSAWVFQGSAQCSMHAVNASFVPTGWGVGKKTDPRRGGHTRRHT